MSVEIPRSVSEFSSSTPVDVISSYSEHEAEVVVEQKETVADGVIALTLADAHGRELPAWTPGAHIDVVLPGMPLPRQYSLCSNPADRHRWRIGILREPKSRGGSEYIHDVLKAGDKVRVRGPRNHFTLVEAPRYLFIAGGIGITPILPMAAEANARGAEWQLLYGGRRRTSLAFLDELVAYGDRVRVYPEDEAGLLPLASFLEPPRNDTLVYVCGPEPLLAAVEHQCATWPTGSLHFERFKAKPPSETAAAPAVAETFEVIMQRSGTTVTIPPNKSILEVVEGAGAFVLSACREGICGTCETGVLEGVPDHRDSVLTPAERETNEVMMICVSRSCTKRLVLDL
jgi:ferredoxin-NADP reductase